MKISKYLLLNITCILLSCSSDENAPFNENQRREDESSRQIAKYIYVASGTCYAGGVAVSPGAATIARYHRDSGQFDKMLIDYGSLATGDMPISLIDKNDEELLVVVENTGGRRIDVINKKTFAVNTYLTNTAALNGVIRSAKQIDDKSILISKSTGIEKFNSARARVTIGTAAYVAAPGGACAPSTTLISSIATLRTGNIIYTHAAATPNNKIGIISSTGYATAANCLATHAAPATTAMPTSILFHSSGKLLVAYGSTTAASNVIYSYTISPLGDGISNPVLAYQDIANINGPSAMVEDPHTKQVLISNGINTYNNVHRFDFNSTTGTLSLATDNYISASLFTRCISSMVVGE